MINMLEYAEPKPDQESPYWWFSKFCLVKHQLSSYFLRHEYIKEVKQVNSYFYNVSHLSLDSLVEMLWLDNHFFAQGITKKNRKQFLQRVAVVKAILTKKLNIEPYDVQIMAVLAMYDGYLVQLSPGEGKTVTIGLLSVLYAMSNKPCHVITSNDYLASRDATLLEDVFSSCRLSVGIVLQTMSQDEKRASYRCSLVYTTAKQLLADFLTDQIMFGGKVSRVGLSINNIKGKDIPLLMRGLHSVIIDEADNIMIDEAITPMIISGPEPNPLLLQALELAHSNIGLLYADEDYVLDESFRDVEWTHSGQQKLNKIAQMFPGLWKAPERYEDLFSQAVLARDYFKENHHFVVDNDQLVIIDEGTGRPMPGRTWSYGLHQAIEKKAGVSVSDPNKTLAKLSFQNYFKYYHRITGASGTLQGVNYEVFYNYRLFVLPISSRLKSRLRVHKFRVYKNRTEKIIHIFRLAQKLHAEGVPVLIGTKRINDSEDLASFFEKEIIPFRLLNAKKLNEEAQIVSEAGKAGRITIATNMAGRGTDIKLSSEVIEQGGLRVIMFEPHESRRIDWQLFGRAGRQGQPGEVFPMCALDDEIIKNYLPQWIVSLLHLVLEFRLTVPLWDSIIYFCQKRAEKKSFRLRKFINYASDENRKKMSFSHID